MRLAIIDHKLQSNKINEILRNKRINVDIASSLEALTTFVHIKGERRLIGTSVTRSSGQPLKSDCSLIQQ